jgi:hypothetical protein
VPSFDAGEAPRRSTSSLERMIQRCYENRWWFVLFGDRIVLMIAALSLAPAIYATWLVHQSKYIAGAAVGIAWLLSDSILLIALHNRRVVRLAISVTCTLAVLGAGSLVVFGIL